MQFVAKPPGPLNSHICYCLRWSQRVWSCLAVRSNSVILHYTLHFWPALSSEITTASQTNHQGHTGNCSSPRFQIPKARRILIKSLSWSHFLADCRRAQLKAISCFHWGQLVEIWSERGNLILARLISCPVLHHPRFGLRRAMWSQENKSSPGCDVEAQTNHYVTDSSKQIIIHVWNWSDHSRCSKLVGHHVQCWTLDDTWWI